MASPEILLTEVQRLEFTEIPQNIDRYEIIKFYTFSNDDIKIINKHRKNYNRLGFAVQLAMLRNPGWPFSMVNTIPRSVLNYISEQIDVNPEELQLYARRENTRLEHLKEIRLIYGFRYFSKQDSLHLIKKLILAAMENNNIISLIKLAINEIKKQKIIIPGITTIEKIVSEAMSKADYK